MIAALLIETGQSISVFRHPAGSGSCSTAVMVFHFGFVFRLIHTVGGAPDDKLSREKKALISVSKNGLSG